MILSQTGIDRGHVARGFVIASKGAALTFSLASCRLTMDEYAYVTYVSYVRLFILCVLFAKACLNCNGFMAWPLNCWDSDNSDRPRHNVKTAGFGALFVRRLVHVQLWVQNLVRSIALCIACIGELNYSYNSKDRPFRQVWSFVLWL